MRLRKAERIAAMAVLTAAAAVAGAGIRLAKKHTAYLMQKAAARFKDDNAELAAETAEDAGTAGQAQEAAEQDVQEKAD